MIQAIGYDVEGTMVDSEPLHNVAWHQVLHDFGKDFVACTAYPTA